MPSSRLLLALAFTLGSIAPALADEAKAPPDPKAERLSLEQFGRDHPECAEWSDDCAVCRRLADGSQGCSLPGFACLATAPACRPEPAKADAPQPSPPIPKGGKPDTETPGPQPTPPAKP